MHDVAAPTNLLSAPSRRGDGDGAAARVGETRAALPRADLPVPRAAPWRMRRTTRVGRRVGPAALSLLLHSLAFGAAALFGIAASTPEGLGPSLDLSFAPCPELASVVDVPPCETLEMPEVEVTEPVPQAEPAEPLPLEETPVDLEDVLLEPPDVRHLASAPELLEVPLSAAVRRKPAQAVVVASSLQPTPPARPLAVRVSAATPRPRPPRATPPRAPGGTGGRLRAIRSPIDYPPEARRLGLEGRARVEMLIQPDGRVSSVRLVSSSGSQVLDRAALASARQWLFAPPGSLRRIVQPFRFRLR